MPRQPPSRNLKRVGKIVRLGRSRANVGVDFYNLLNAATPLSYNQAFIANGP